MIVMGGMIGSGIFMNTYIAARHVHTPFLIVSAWILGGLIAFAGACSYAELAAARPDVGGQYAYIRDAYHPSVAFLYGWGLLVIAQSGGMAAVAITFARYLGEAMRTRLPEAPVAAALLAVLAIINCLGVRTWAAVQNGLTILKTVLVALLVVCGYLFVARPQAAPGPLLDRPVSLDLATAIGAALVPILFAYGGWQTSCFIAGEVREPRKNLPRALLIGVGSVVLLYIGVNYVSVRALGSEGLAQATAPATAVMRIVAGEMGALMVAAGIALSAAGFLMQCMLTVPRVYLAMAEDGLFIGKVKWRHPRTGMPVAAIVLQAGVAIVIAFSGKYEQILSWIVPVDFFFYGLAASCVFVFRHRKGRAGASSAQAYPLAPVLFVAACCFVVVVSIYCFPRESLIGWSVVLTGIPVYLLWDRRRRGSRASASGL